MKGNSIQIILFDSECLLCNRLVHQIIAADTAAIFRFVALNSDLGKSLLEERNLNSLDTDTIVLIVPSVAYYIKSEAVFEIVKSLGGVWLLFAAFQWLPTVITNYLYDLVAKNRKRFFTNAATCVLPSKKDEFRFITELP